MSGKRPYPPVPQGKHPMNGESKHTVQVGALESFMDSQTPVLIITSSGRCYSSASIVQYDQFTIAAVCDGRSILLYKHAIESIEAS